MHIARHEFKIEKEIPSIGCTVSIGLASSAMLEGGDATELYKMADARLYIAKNTGRNQVSADEIVAVD